jgi:hypothetical protein
MMTEQNSSVVELQKRWDKIRVANIYDTLDHMGYGNQCIDLGIKPLFPHRHMAGMAITVRGSAYPVARGDAGDSWVGSSFSKLRESLYPGCVVVVESGGETQAGKFGEMTSWALQQGGARGIVLDSFIRDWRGLGVVATLADGCGKRAYWNAGDTDFAGQGYAGGLDRWRHGWRDRYPGGNCDGSARKGRKAGSRRTRDARRRCSRHVV